MHAQGCVILSYVFRYLFSLRHLFGMPTPAPFTALACKTACLTRRRVPARRRPRWTSGKHAVSSLSCSFAPEMQLSCQERTLRALHGRRGRFAARRTHGSSQTVRRRGREQGRRSSTVFTALPAGWRRSHGTPEGRGRRFDITLSDSGPRCDEPCAGEDKRLRASSVDGAVLLVPYPRHPTRIDAAAKFTCASQDAIGLDSGVDSAR
jgi:hypothetical protein